MKSLQHKQSGITLLELMITVSLIGILSAVALPTYQRYVDGLKLEEAKGDLMKIFMAVTSRRDANGRVPDTLPVMAGIPTTDPWGRAYVYNSFTRPGFRSNEIRKDHNLHPINSEFDIFSVGEDGTSRAPLTARPSRDDIILARDGSFIGLAKDF